MKKLSYPYFFWMIIFIVIPLFLIIFISFTDENSSFTLANYARTLEPAYLKVMYKSVKLSAISTIICFFVSYPAAYILSTKNYVNKKILLFTIVAPMWINFLLRTYAWLTILENNGILNETLAFFGFSKQQLLYTDGAVLLGMVYNFLPFMILPIYNSLIKIDKNLLFASQDLGANSFQTFTKVVFPLTISGVISGITMVFMPALTTFIIPELLGGGQYFLIGNLIEQQFLKSNNWNFGAALSLNLFIFIVLFMFVSNEDDGGSIL
ncbi:MAG: ABC transporter permease [Lachnospirales bacterium]